MHTESVILKPWPYPGMEELCSLYEQVDQRYCLVALPVPLSPVSSAAYLKAVHSGTTGEKELLTRAVMLGDELIGKIELNRDADGSAEADIVLKRQYTGKGYGAEAFRQLTGFVKEEGWCDLITAYVHKENIHARRMFRKAGMRETRPFRADVLIPDDGKYILKPVEGYEYILPL